MKNKNCSRYLRDLKHLMPIYGKKQRKYLYTLKQSIDDFCISTPTPTYEDLINHFGTPQEIIGDYIREQDTKILLKQINRNYYLQIILRILFISAFVCCILYGINCYRAYLHCIQSEPVYMYEEISTDNVNKGDLQTRTERRTIMTYTTMNKATYNRGLVVLADR